MAKVKENNTNIQLNLKSRNPVIEFDKLQLYFAKPYVIDVPNADGSITVTQPTIANIVDIGEKRFFATLNIFTCNTTSYRLMLWENGIDWNKISDFELFIILYKGIDKEVSDLFFNIDFSKFLPFEKQIDENTKELVLYDSEDKIEINKDIYNHFCQYIRNVFNIFPEEKLTDDAALKQLFIYKDKSQLKNEELKEKKGTQKSSSMLSTISSCLNHPGFKYNSTQLKELHVYEFYDSVKRLQTYEQTTALLKGMYSGMIDGSKIKSEEYNFMRDI